MSNNSWMPEICYEETNEGESSNIPFINVPIGQEMPKLLYVFESRDTGSFEPDEDGNELPIVDWDLHQYADMAMLKETLRPELFDEVRISLGLQALSEAIVAGQTITDNVRLSFDD